MATLNFQESRKFIKSLERSQELIKKTKSIVLLSHELLSTKIYHTSINILYILFISRKFQKCKNIKIQQVHQEIHTKQFLLFYLNCFLLSTHLNLMRLNKGD